MGTNTGTIDVTPSWAWAAEVLLAVLSNGTKRGKEDAAAELRNMAKVADMAVGMKDALADVLRELDNTGTGTPNMFDAYGERNGNSSPTPEAIAIRDRLQARIAAILKV